MELLICEELLECFTIIKTETGENTIRFFFLYTR